MEHESDDDTNCNWYACKTLQKLIKVLKDLEIRRQAETIRITALSLR